MVATVAEVLGVDDGVTDTKLVEEVEEEDEEEDDETTEEEPEEPLPLPEEFGVELEPQGRMTTKIWVHLPSMLRS